MVNCQLSVEKIISYVKNSLEMMRFFEIFKTDRDKILILWDYDQDVKKNDIRINYFSDVPLIDKKFYVDNILKQLNLISDEKFNIIFIRYLNDKTDKIVQSNNLINLKKYPLSSVIGNVFKFPDDDIFDKVFDELFKVINFMFNKEFSTSNNIDWKLILDNELGDLFVEIQTKEQLDPRLTIRMEDEITTIMKYVCNIYTIVIFRTYKEVDFWQYNHINDETGKIIGDLYYERDYYYESEGNKIHNLSI